MANKLKNIIVSILFISFITIMLIINIIKKDTIISQSERRKLQQMPNISITSLLNGTWFEKFDKYVTDQFILRDNFRSMKLSFELNILKKQDYNNIFCSNGYLAEQIYPLNEKSILNILNKIKYIKNTYLSENNKIYYTIIPDKNYYINDNHLKLDYSKMENIISQNLQFAKYINIFDSLDLSCYYKTDTHWRQEKLNKVMQKIASAMNLEINNNYKYSNITSFKGVYSGQYPLTDFEDTITVLTNDILDECSVYNYETKKITQIYDIDKVNSYDKYDIYLSGATPLLKIENPSHYNEKELIVFRDSFGSSLIPLITEAYKTIFIVDTRYISPKIINEYITFDNQDILFAYSTIVINNSYSLK